MYVYTYIRKYMYVYTYICKYIVLVIVEQKRVIFHLFFFQMF